MARNRKSHRRAGGLKLPVAVIAGFTPLAVNVASVSGQGFGRMGWMATQAMTGYDTDTQKFWMPNMWKGLFPIMLGIGIHKVASALGVNRALGSAGVPLLRV